MQVLLSHRYMGRSSGIKSYSKCTENAHTNHKREFLYFYPNSSVLKVHHWFRYSLLATCSVPSLYLDQCWIIVNCTNSVKIYKKMKTRQHSTQSIGNMPPPSPRHLLPHVLQIMPRNPKYDQFQPKGRHNEENPQSATKMPVNPKFYPFH